MSISGAGGGARTGGGAVARQGAGNFPLTEDLRKIKRQIAVAREKFKRLESFTRKDLQEALVNLRKKGVDALLMMEQKTGEAQGRTEDWVQSLQEAQNKLQDLTTVSLEGVAPQPADAEEVEAAEREDPSTPSISDNIPDRIRAPQGGGSDGPSEAERRLASFRAQLRKSFRQLNALGQVGARAFLRIGRGAGRTLGRILTFQQEVKGVGDAFKQVGASVVRVLQRMIQQLVQAVATAAALRAAIAVIPGLNAIGGASTFGGLLSGVLGLAEGGIVTGPTLAVVGEGQESEAVMPLSKLEAMIQPAQPSAQPAMAGGGQMSIQKAGAEAVEVAGGSISIDIPVEAVSRANEQGQSRVSRTGRRR
jgi:hypothetical protein